MAESSPGRGGTRTCACPWTAHVGGWSGPRRRMRRRESRGSRLLDRNSAPSLSVHVMIRSRRGACVASTPRSCASAAIARALCPRARHAPAEQLSG